MKNLTIINNEWKERIPLQLSESDKVLLAQQGNKPNEARKALAERIRNGSIIAATPEDAAAAQAIYDQQKIEGADLIAADVSLPEGTGIINCRLNGDHKQIRF